MAIIVKGCHAPTPCKQYMCTFSAESMEDADGTEGSVEKVDEVVNELQVDANNVGESSAHSQGISW